MSRRVLIVEDDEAIQLALRATLEDEGYSVLQAYTAEESIPLLAIRPDAALVDLRLPGMHGMDLIRRIRQDSTMPILVVSAQADSADIVAGLQAGADDYVTKPFVVDELIARIGAQMRRTAPAAASESRVLSTGRIEVRLDNAEVFRDGTLIPLSRIEFDVLVELIRADGRVLSRDHLLRTVWGYSYPGDGRVVDTLVYRLRGKLEEQPAHPTLLLTVRGFGYRIDPARA